MIHDPKVLAALADMARALHCAGTALETLLGSASSISPAIDRSISAKRETSEKSPRKFPARWCMVNSDWPRIGGRHFVAPPREIFLSDAYRALYRPGWPRTCYVATCDGTEAMSKKFMVPIDKASTCDDGRLSDRLKEIGAEEYGSVFLLAGREIRETGFSRWRTVRIPSGLVPSPNSPVLVTKEALVACIPETMSKKQFDDRYDELVRLGSINAWLETDAGILHCDRVGVDPDFGRRYTPRQYDRSSTREQSLEIVAFRTKNDYARLIAIIERVILEHLGLFRA